MFDFMIQHAYTNTTGNKIDNYFLSSYAPSKENTAYGHMREAVITSINKNTHSWLSVSLVFKEDDKLHMIFQMKGNLKWLQKVEYFRKFIGDMGGTDDLSPVSYGFTDRIHNIRVEFEQGIVNILHLK